jgi:hypothetical protein
MTKIEMDGICSTYRARGTGVYGVVEGKLKRKATSKILSQVGGYY